MDRRDFLKTLGLGGLALTLPKPLSILEAKASDLVAPPIHVGFCRFENLEKFPLYDFSMYIPDKVIIDQDRFLDVTHHWNAHLVIRRDHRSYMPLYQGRLWHHPHAPFLNQQTFRGRGLVPDAYINCLPTDTVECWLASDGKSKFPVPPMRVTLLGAEMKPATRWESRVAGFYYGSDAPDVLVRHTVYKDMNTVQIERTEAIKRGFALPSDPFEAL